MWTSTVREYFSREEMHDLRGAVLKSDPSLTKVMLAELTWQTLEPYHWRFGFMRTDAADQIVDSRLTTLVAKSFEASEYFTGLEWPILWLARFFQATANGLFMLLCSTGTAYIAGFAEIKIIGAGHGWFAPNSTYCSQATPVANRMTL